MREIAAPFFTNTEFFRSLLDGEKESGGSKGGHLASTFKKW